MALGKAGANRQEMHENIRNISMKAWDVVRNGESNPLVQMIINEPSILRYINANDLLSLMDVQFYIGDASRRAKVLAEKISENV